MPSLQGGGAERVVLDLADRFRMAGHEVEVVVGRRKGDYAKDLPEGLSVVELGSRGWLGRLQAFRADPLGVAALARPVLFPKRTSKSVGYLPGLVEYLRREQPDALLSVLSFTNLVAIWAREVAGVETRVVVSERNTLSQSQVATEKRRNRWRRRYLPQLIGRTYLRADTITTVSDGVADDLARVTGLPRESLVTVYNPVVTERLLAGAQQPVDHPWFEPGGDPVILAVGRLRPQKDFATLLRAFATLREKRRARLVVLGEGSGRAKLEALATELAVADDVWLPGFVRNPFAYMAKASVFVLSSKFEGLPGVLIQAIACGCNAVSTDCPSGPREVLDDGRFGALVPVGDDQAMAAAIEAAIDRPLPADTLRERAAFFSPERATANYLALLLPEGASRDNRPTQ
ncbi:MAG: glycosyltransferase [bacterium]|nr:glycosyltransferase [bacterium]